MIKHSTIRLLAIAGYTAAGVLWAGQAVAASEDLQDPKVTGTSPDYANEYAIYHVDASTCAVDKLDPTPAPPATAELEIALQAAPADPPGKCNGTTSIGPGGNVELGGESFEGKAIHLQGKLFGATTDNLTLSSLISSGGDNDWTKDVGGISLAEKFLYDLIAATCGVIPGESGFDDLFPIDSGVPGISFPDFQSLVQGFLFAGTNRLSDPNISYVRGHANADTRVLLGLAGHLDAAGLVPEFDCPNQREQPQVSEVVRIQLDTPAIDTYLYSFTATESGLSDSDTVQSFDANFAFDVPFAAPVGEIGGEFDPPGSDHVEWSTTWKNPNPQSTLVLIVIPIPDNAEFPTDGKVECSGAYQLDDTRCDHFDNWPPVGEAIVFEGFVPPTIDPANPATLTIRYALTTTEDEMKNVANACWDEIGNGSPVSSCPNEPDVIKEEDTVQRPPVDLPLPPPRPVPAIGMGGLMFLLLALGGAGGLLRRGRDHGKRA